MQRSNPERECIEEPLTSPFPRKGQCSQEEYLEFAENEHGEEVRTVLSSDGTDFYTIWVYAYVKCQESDNYLNFPKHVIDQWKWSGKRGSFENYSNHGEQMRDCLDNLNEHVWPKAKRDQYMANFWAAHDECEPSEETS